MQMTINLTPILVTIVICIILYAISNIAAKDEGKKSQNKEQNIIDYIEEQAKRSKEEGRRNK